MTYPNLDILKPSTFYTINNLRLTKLIMEAQKRIDFIGTGFCEEVIQNLLQKINLVGTIIVDNSEFVYKSGYSDINAIAALKNTGKLQVAKNIRINCLRVDDKAFVYSPTPLVLEEDPEIGFPNAIILSANDTDELFRKINVVSESEYETVEPSNAEGLVVKDLSIQEIETVQQVINQNPPRFDLDRKLNVYKNKLKFVEIQLRGLSLAQHTIKIPNELLKFTKKDTTLRGQLKASYSIFANKDDKIVRSADKITEMVDGVRRKYIFNIKKYGAVVHVKEKNNLDKEIKMVQAEIELFKSRVNIDIEKALDKAKKNVLTLLYPVVKQNPPENLTRFLDEGQKLTRAEIEGYILSLLDRTFIDSESFTKGMELTVTYKDITYDTIKSDDFINAVKETPLRFAFREEELLEEEMAVGIAQY